MKRMATGLALFVALAGMGKTLSDEPLPFACDVLRAIDIAATLGPGTTFEQGALNETTTVRLSLCSAETPDLPARMSLMVTETLDKDVPDAASLRARMVKELHDSMGEDLVIEEVQIGDAAIWVGDIGQLIVWHREGQVMFILGPTPTEDRASAETAAGKILATFP